MAINFRSTHLKIYSILLPTLYSNIRKIQKILAAVKFVHIKYYKIMEISSVFIFEFLSFNWFLHSNPHLIYLINQSILLQFDHLVQVLKQENIFSIIIKGDNTVVLYDNLRIQVRSRVHVRIVCCKSLDKSQDRAF